MRKKVLISVNEKQILDILSFAIGREGYEIIRALNGNETIQLTDSQHPDIIILGLVPPMCNSETCHHLREADVTIPIITLVEQETVLKTNEATVGLETSRFIRKPFAMKELLLEISDTLRCESTVTEMSTVESPQKQLGRIVIDLEQVLVTKDGIALDLSNLEFGVLNCLSGEPGRVFSREELMSLVWKYPGFLGDVRCVDVAVRRLREKIEDDPAHPKSILTRRGHGYLFVQQ